MIELMRRILRIFESHHLWEEGVELIGSWCFYLYQRHLGIKPYPFKTQDVDFLLPYPYRGKEKFNLVSELEELGFQRDFRHDGSLYLWNAELRVEFIVPDRGKGMEHAAAIPSLGIRAVPLRFVDVLLSHPVTVIEDGIKVSIPDPAVFCLHKLLISVRRQRTEKRVKDFEQALHVLSGVKENRLKEVYLEFPKAWQRKVIRSLEQAQRSVPMFEEEAKQLAVTLQKMK